MLCLHARGKINWTLDILGVREDGYHRMDMLMQSVALHDTLWLEESDVLSLEDAGNSLRTSVGPGPSSAAPVRFDESNLVYRAARSLQQAVGVSRGARVLLRKGIPSGAGMGGGSADAAAALIGLNRLWGLGLSWRKLEEIGLGLGADVPFMLRGGLCRVGGIGEELRPLRPARQYWLTLWQPCDGLSTGEIFRAFDGADPAALSRPLNDQAETALRAGDLPLLCRSMNNVLESASREKRPEIAKAARTLERLGALRAMMTGSGSVIYGVFPDREAAEAAESRLAGEKGFHAVTSTEAEGARFVPCDGRPGAEEDEAPHEILRKNSAGT